MSETSSRDSTIEEPLGKWKRKSQRISLTPEKTELEKLNIHETYILCGISLLDSAFSQAMLIRNTGDPA
jgi:hypothetical protein